jgi:hypothetical protein
MNEQLWEIYCALADIKKSIDNVQTKICKMCPKLEVQDKKELKVELSTISPEDYD